MFNVYSGSGDHNFISTGGSSSITLRGGSGDHSFTGGEYWDELVVVGGTGDHSFTGGEGWDRIYISAFDSGSVDWTDFTHEGDFFGFGDSISLSRDVFYRKSGEEFILTDRDGDRFIIDINMDTSNVKIHGGTLLLDSSDVHIDFDSSRPDWTGKWRLSEYGNIKYNLDSDSKVVFSDLAGNIDSLLDFSQAHAEGKFEITEQRGNITLEFGGSDITLDKEEDFNADADSSGDISFEEFVDAIGSDNLAFS